MVRLLKIMGFEKSLGIKRLWLGGVLNAMAIGKTTFCPAAILTSHLTKRRRANYANILSRL